MSLRIGFFNQLLVFKIDITFFKHAAKIRADVYVTSIDFCDDERSQVSKPSH